MSAPDPSEAEDIALLHAIAAGDTDALAVFYDRYRVKVFRGAYGVVRCIADAEEVMQDVFLRVWLHAGTYTTTRGHVRTWLYTLTMRRAVDCLRRRSTRADRAVVSVPEWQRDDKPLPEETVLRHLDGEEIHDALTMLPAPQREAVVLAFLEEWSHTEIAAHLTLPLGTVKGRIRSGLRAMRTVVPVA